MSGQSTLLENIERLEAATAECREATREAHAATKDLNRARAEAAKVIEQGVEKAVQLKLDAATREGSEAIITATQDALDACVDKVTTEVQTLFDLLMGGKPKKGEQVLPRIDDAIRLAVSKELRPDVAAKRLDLRKG